MARACNCHRNTREAMAKGMKFADADRIHGKNGYHEHRCECPCGCKNNTLGYAHCASCSFDKECWKLRGQVGVGPLAIPIMSQTD